MKSLTDNERELWQSIASKLADASALIGDCQLILHNQLTIYSGKPYDAMNEIYDAIAGQSYMFTPQPEWIGGDNYKTNPPHIAR